MFSAMIAARDAKPRRLARASVLAAVGLALVAGGVFAAPAWIERLLSRGDAVASPAGARHGPAHYRTDEGGGFVIDHASDRVLLKFDNSPEVWALTGARGPRGDLIYFDDAGRTLLRTNQMGGVTVFTDRRPGGSAATVETDTAATLQITSVSAAALYQRLVQVSARAGSAAGHAIAFEAPDADPLSDGVIADAIGVAGEAIVTLAGGREGRRMLTHIDKVQIDHGAESGVLSRAGVLKITIAPALGFAGRPSSARIAQALDAK